MWVARSLRDTAGGLLLAALALLLLAGMRPAGTTGSGDGGAGQADRRAAPGLPPAGPAVDIDHRAIGLIYPGVRIVTDPNGFFSFTELGISGGFKLGSTGFYSGLMRLDLRFVY